MKSQRIYKYFILGGVFLLFVLLGLGIFRFSGFGPFMAYVNGESVFVTPKKLDLGRCEADSQTVAIFKMTNLTSKEISVVGERSSCNCAFSEQIPVIAAPGKTVDIKVNVHLPKYDTSYDQTITFMVAEPDRLAMYPVRVTATVPHPLTKPIETIPNERE